ncbi:hypothetical protein [Sulfurimonas sp. CS5]|uniref:hypothetical protein n=1 Tax=Sulfurimonas sp. CS5 TaxID=3391145 RepID=UPI0039EC1E45
MQNVVVEHLGGYPQKLIDLQWLEDELQDVNQDEVGLDWNKQRKCVEHKFTDDLEVEYYVLEHWADHVGAKFNITQEANKDGFFSAFIYR